MIRVTGKLYKLIAVIIKIQYLPEDYDLKLVRQAKAWATDNSMSNM